MNLIKQLLPSARKFTPASAEVNWGRIETLVHGPGASASSGDDLNSAVFACLMALAMAEPEPPLQVKRQTSAGKSEKLPESPLQKLLDQPTPNSELTMEEMRFWKAWAKHVDGNAYWLKVRSGDALTGNVVQLWPISPTLIKPITRKGSDDWISYYQYQYESGKFKEVPVNNIIHFRLGLDDRDMRKGLAPLKALVRQISTDDEADHFVDALLKNYAVPGLVVVPDETTDLDQEAADDMTDRLRRKFGSSNRGNVAVMSKKVDVKAFGFSPKDLDMSILHRIPEERISAVIGVPAIVAGLGAGLDRATYANFKEAREMFTESKMIPQWRADGRKLTNSLRPDFTTDRRVFIDHDLTDVRALQEDEDAKYRRLQGAVGKPWITRNEARTDTGLEPVDGWDEEDIAKPEPPPVQPPPAAQPTETQPPDKTENPVRKDLERWFRKAYKALHKTGSAACNFESDYIPEKMASEISAGLSDCKTMYDIEQLMYARDYNVSVEDIPVVEAANRLAAAIEGLQHA
jgi:HK97 family phage portal protein